MNEPTSSICWSPVLGPVAKERRVIVRPRLVLVAYLTWDWLKKISHYRGWMRNPAPVDSWFIPRFIGFQDVSSILLAVQDFATIHAGVVRWSALLWLQSDGTSEFWADGPRAFFPGEWESEHVGLYRKMGKTYYTDPYSSCNTMYLATLQWSIEFNSSSFRSNKNGYMTNKPQDSHSHRQ